VSGGDAMKIAALVLDFAAFDSTGLTQQELGRED
jgi:hypothetical protein